MAENKDGQEKTEDASRKRLDDARDKGQVAKSTDVTTAVVLLIGGMVIFLLGGIFINDYKGFMAYLLVHSNEFIITEANVFKYYPGLLLFAGKIILPIALIIFSSVLISEISQVGLKVATKKFSNPEEYTKVFKLGSGIKRIFFSSRAYFELVKNFAKVVLLGGLVYWMISRHFDEIVSISEKPYLEIGSFMSEMAFSITLTVGGFYIVIAVVDYIFQKRKFKEDMKMTKHEVKEENKQMEGDPRVKQRLRAIMRGRIRKLMMQNVSKADVVITNPTHFAVAVAYDSQNMNAPKVLAKGTDFLALKIREEATKYGIPIVEEPPLARAIYHNVEVEHEIPENLFKAVAQILAYVYSLKDMRK